METLPIILDITRLALLSIVIGIAALSDHKCGEVKNKVWIYAPFGFCLTCIATILTPETALPAFVSMGATTIMALLLFYMGGWGGADGKAFLTIAASMPLAPFRLATVLPIYPLAVVITASIISFAYSAVKQRKVPIMKRQARFLPYTFVCLFIALFI